MTVSHARYHASLPPVVGWDSLGALLRTAEGNARSAATAGLPEEPVRGWLERVTAALQARRTWLADRVTEGFVRRCHGDLHLGNLCLWQGTPVPFDALEFDEELGTIDIGYDLAFLLMDPDRCVSRAAANRAMNRTIARNGDVVVTRGFPPFLSLRAMVRAHVRAASGQTEEAHAYLAAAQAYLSPPPPFVLAIGGLQGTGKSPWRGSLRLSSVPRQVRLCCAATKSANGCTASLRRFGCRRAPIRMRPMRR